VRRLVDEERAAHIGCQNQRDVTTSLSSAESKELIRLCETGRLYDVDAWVAAGKSLKTPPDIRKTPLGVALSTGFHSLVEFLLRNEQSQQAKNDALRWAIQCD
jgi:hypothetical protein